MAAHADVDPVLRDLHRHGFTALASEVVGLQPQKTECTPDVLQHQQRYARLTSSDTALVTTRAFSGSLLLHAPLLPQQEVAVAVTFDVVQAPSSFCLPVMQKRPWEPPFQVRMTWRSSVPLQVHTSVAAFVVDEAVLPSMLTWQLPSPQEAARQLVEHQQERTVVLATAPPTQDEPADGGCQMCHAAEALFSFSKLQFGQPSQMRPRWLVFAGRLPGGGCVFSHYRVPTVVMSRMADQFDKAKRVLWGCVEPACEGGVQKMDYRQLCKHVRRELAAIGIRREPSEEDCRYLAARAGFVVVHGGVRAASASPPELAAFKAWFAGHLVMLKHIRAHYERSDPQVVSGFGMTREAAEALLMAHPKGTFLLRFGSQGGLLVLSVRCGGPAGGPPPVAHYSLPCAALQANGLEALLERNGTAEQLLDTATGQRHFRTAVLDRSYLQVVDVAEVRDRKSVV